MRKIFVFISISIISKSRGISQNIQNDINTYFQSESYKTCQSIWGKYRLSYENTLASALREGYGRSTMNIHIKRAEDALMLSKGYYHTDNQVKIVLQDVLLEQFPYLTIPKIKFDLCRNAFSVESTLSRMIIHADYFLFRDKSDIIYVLKEQNSTNSSPFRFEQVKNNGRLAIIADNCFITGSLFTKLDNGAVNLGIDMIKLTGCQFTLDIYTPGQKTPAVLADYLFSKDGTTNKNILLQALCKEITPMLQGLLYEKVNTSEIFGKDLLSIEHEQKKIVTKIVYYVDTLAGDVNNLLNGKGIETVNMKDFNINWTDGFDGTEKDYGITLTNVTLSGIDSAYSSHIGGPFQIIPNSSRIAERVKLSNVEVLGAITLQGMYEGDYNFAADIYDAEVDILLDVNKLKEPITNTDDHKVTVSGWRTLEFSSPHAEELPMEAIVTGYLRDELPNYLSKSLSNAFTEAILNDTVNQQLSGDTILQDPVLNCSQIHSQKIDESNQKLMGDISFYGETDNRGEITGQKVYGSNILGTNPNQKLMGDISFHGKTDNRGEITGQKIYGSNTLETNGNQKLMGDISFNGKTDNRGEITGQKVHGSNILGTNGNQKLMGDISFYGETDNRGEITGQKVYGSNLLGTNGNQKLMGDISFNGKTDNRGEITGQKVHGSNILGTNGNQKLMGDISFNGETDNRGEITGQKVYGSNILATNGNQKLMGDISFNGKADNRGEITGQKVYGSNIVAANGNDTLMGKFKTNVGFKNRGTMHNRKIKHSNVVVIGKKTDIKDVELVIHKYKKPAYKNHSNGPVMKINVTKKSVHKTYSNDPETKISVNEKSAHKIHSNDPVIKINVNKKSAHKIHRNDPVMKININKKSAHKIHSNDPVMNINVNKKSAHKIHSNDPVMNINVNKKSAHKSGDGNKQETESNGC